MYAIIILVYLYISMILIYILILENNVWSGEAYNWKNK